MQEDVGDRPLRHQPLVSLDGGEEVLAAAWHRHVADRRHAAGQRRLRAGGEIVGQPVGVGAAVRLGQVGVRINAAGKHQQPRRLDHPFSQRLQPRPDLDDTLSAHSDVGTPPLGCGHHGAILD